MPNLIKNDFLLGIGVGFVVSALLLSVFGGGSISDREIMDRAVELGMVKQEPTESGQPAEDTVTAEKEEGQGLGGQAENTGIGQEPAETGQVQEEPGTGSDIQRKAIPTVRIVIKAGMGSETISRILEEKGVVADHNEFYAVVTEMKAHTRFRTGTFDVPAGGDMRELVLILTGRR